MTRRGFTIVELTVVIALIAILAAILFPVFARAREKARQASCTANLFNIGMALRLYAHDSDGCYPPELHDLQPLWPRYFPTQQAFMCPSGMRYEWTMGWQPPPQLPSQPGGSFAPGPGGPPGGPGAPPPASSGGGMPKSSSDLGQPPLAEQIRVVFVQDSGPSAPPSIGWGTDPPPPDPQRPGPGGPGGPPGGPPPGGKGGPPIGGKGGDYYPAPPAPPAVPPSPERGRIAPRPQVSGRGVGVRTPLASSYYYRPALRYNIGPLLPLVADSQPRHNDRANVLFTDGSLRSVTAATWLEHWRPLYDSGAGCRRSRQGPRAGGDNHS